MPNHFPAHFIESLKGITGFDESAFIGIHEETKQVTSIRVNPLKPTHAIESLPISSGIPWCETGRYLSERPSFTFDPVFHGGAYYVQEASSMFIDHILKHIYKDNLPPKMVLDLCAAPGGKSTLLASSLPDSLIVSNEVIKTRVNILAENVAKWGNENIVVTNNDPKDFDRLPGYFDLLVIDAPCSGSGLFRKDKEAMKEWSENNVQHCSMRQRRIIGDTIGTLKKDGYLIYSTCSYSAQEDEDICNFIVEQYHVEPIKIPFDTSWGIVESTDHQNYYGYRFYPDKVDGEGFFIACFRQHKGLDDNNKNQNSLIPINKREQLFVSPFIKSPENYIITGHKEIIIASPKKWEKEISTIAKSLQLRRSGVAIGELKGKDLIPHHELSLSHLTNDSIPTVQLSKEDALHYLKRQDISLKIYQKGWTICRYEDINLGWIKVLPNRVNNYYPVNWRILKQ